MSSLSGFHTAALPTTSSSNHHLYQLLPQVPRRYSPRRRRFGSPIPLSAALKTSFPDVREFAGDDVVEAFLKERHVNGDLITRFTDRIWFRGVVDFADGQENLEDSEFSQSSDEDIGGENEGKFLKLTTTREWLFGKSTVVPLNKRTSLKEIEDDREKRKMLNLLRYEALKKELLFITLGIGTACTGYCLVVFSFQVALSYAIGVAFSCLYLQLLCQHADVISKETVPEIFRQKKPKKIGIRSDDVKDLLLRVVKGSGIALSSPRLVIPGAIYGMWELFQHYGPNFFDFQLAPAIFGMLAYKAAALVQVSRDNEELQFIFPEEEEGSNE